MYFWHSNVVYHNEPGYACFIVTSWRWEVVACQVLLLWVLLFGSVGARETASEWMRVLFVFRRRYRHSLAVLRLLISANSLTCASIINATIYYFNQTWHCYSVTLNTHHDLCVLRCDLRQDFSLCQKWNQSTAPTCFPFTTVLPWRQVCMPWSIFWGLEFALNLLRTQVSHDTSYSASIYITDDAD